MQAYSFFVFWKFTLKNILIMSTERLENTGMNFFKIKDSLNQAFSILEGEGKKISEALLEDIAQLMFALKLQLSQKDLNNSENRITKAMKTIHKLAHQSTDLAVQQAKASVDLNGYITGDDTYCELFLYYVFNCGMKRGYSVELSLKETVG